MYSPTLGVCGSSLWRGADCARVQEWCQQHACAVTCLSAASAMSHVLLPLSRYNHISRFSGFHIRQCLSVTGCFHLDLPVRIQPLAYLTKHLLAESLPRTGMAFISSQLFVVLKTWNISRSWPLEQVVLNRFSSKKIHTSLLGTEV